MKLKLEDVVSLTYERSPMVNVVAQLEEGLDKDPCSTYPTTRLLRVLNDFVKFLNREEGPKNFNNIYVFYDPLGTGKTHTMEFLRIASQDLIRLNNRIDYRSKKLDPDRNSRINSLTDRGKRRIKSLMALLPPAIITSRNVKPIVISYSKISPKKYLHLDILQELSGGDVKSVGIHEALNIIRRSLGKNDRLLVLIDDLHTRYNALVESGEDIRRIGSIDIDFIRSLSEFPKAFIIISSNRVPDQEVDEILRYIREIGRRKGISEVSVIDTAIEFLYGSALCMDLDSIIEEESIIHLLSRLGTEESEGIIMSNVLRDVIRYFIPSLEAIKGSDLNFFAGTVPGGYIKNVLKREAKDKEAIDDEFAIYERRISQGIRDTRLRLVALAVFKGIYITQNIGHNSLLIADRVKDNSLLRNSLSELSRLSLIAKRGDNYTVIPLPYIAIRSVRELLKLGSEASIRHVFLIYSEVCERGNKEEICKVRNEEEIKNLLKEKAREAALNVFRKYNVSPEYPDVKIEEIDISDAIKRLIAYTYEAVREVIEAASKPETYAHILKRRIIDVANREFKRILKEVSAGKYIRYITSSGTFTLAGLEIQIRKISEIIKETAIKAARERSHLRAITIDEIANDVSKALNIDKKFIKESVDAISDSLLKELGDDREYNQGLFKRKQKDPSKELTNKLRDIGDRLRKGKRVKSYEISSLKELLRVLNKDESEVIEWLSNYVGPCYLADRNLTKIIPLSEAHLDHLSLQCYSKEKIEEKLADKFYDIALKEAKRIIEISGSLSESGLMETIKELLPELPEGIDEEVVAKEIYRRVVNRLNGLYSKVGDKRVREEERKEERVGFLKIYWTGPSESRKVSREIRYKASIEREIEKVISIFSEDLGKLRRRLEELGARIKDLE